MQEILLSFDIEEFDLPLEHGGLIDENTQMEISRKGLENILSLLDKLDISATFFITANFAIHYPELITRIASRHEVGSHAYYHSVFNPGHLEKSKSVLEELTNKKIYGIRLPRLKHIDSKEIQEAGYIYNASLNPTYIPGRYNNFFKKRTPSLEDNILIMPVSVSPLFRFPLFWLSFKNFPLPFMKYISKRTLKNDCYLSLYYHSWEFADINTFKLPYYLKKKNGLEMIKQMESYLSYLKKIGTFTTHYQYLKNSKLLF